MLMAPLGALIMPALKIGPKEFGLVVSAYAFSAGVASFLTAGFADRALGLVGGAVVAWRMRPVADHLAIASERSPWRHLLHTLAVPRHALAFATTALLTTGGFMLMPFSTAFAVNNLGIGMADLPTVYLVTGLCTIVVGPLVGRASDAFGTFRVFAAGTALSIVMVLLYTHLGPIGLTTLIAVNAVMFVGIFSRMIPFQAISSGVPASAQRGAYNAVGASIQQLAGGVASVMAGHIVTLGSDGRLLHFDRIGYVVVGTSLVAFALLRALVRGGSSAS